MSYITLKEAAEYTGKSIHTLRKIIKNPDIKIKKEYRSGQSILLIRKQDLDNRYKDDITKSDTPEITTDQPLTNNHNHEVTNQINNMVNNHNYTADSDYTLAEKQEQNTVMINGQDMVTLIKKQLEEKDIQLKEKDLQLERKDEQIAGLIKSREHADIMLNEAQKQLFLLQAGIQNKSKTEEKKGLWSRLFKNKNKQA